uniref:Uncharacterized protein n=1 Tax=Clastoptera arizonana TaxID=38151 RepID=A0A1B6DZD1_9HEMI
MVSFTLFVLLSITVILTSELSVLGEPLYDGPIVKIIRKKLTENLKPEYLDVRNKCTDGTERFLRVYVVSSMFYGKRQSERSEMVREIIKKELKHDVIAITLNTDTPTEWTPPWE